MKRETTNYTLVGAVVVAAVALLLITLFVITGRDRSAQRYYVFYRNVTGLSYGAPVFYQGLRIGQVVALEPERTDEGTRFKVEIGVRADWEIPDDSVARLQSTGLLADVAIAIREGKSATILASGAELKGEEGADIFGALSDLASEVTVLTRDRITPLITTLNTRLGSITGTLDERLPPLMMEAQNLLAKLTLTAESVNEVFGKDNRAAITGILGDVRGATLELKDTREKLDQLLDQLRRIAKENRPGVRQAVADLETILGAMSRRIDAIAHHLESSSRNLDEFSREIRKYPNRLLFTPKADKVEVEK